MKVSTKDITQKINYAKQEIDKLKIKLEKKEEERKAQNRGKPADLDAYADEDEIPQEDIIDEEELVFLKDLKEMNTEKKVGLYINLFLLLIKLQLKTRYLFFLLKKIKNN